MSAFANLDQALKDLIESYTELEEETEQTHGDDEDSYSQAIIEALETSVETAIEEHDVSTTTFATILSHLTEALEQLDPSAFEDEESHDAYDMNDVADADDVEDIDDIDDDIDADLDEEDIDIDDDEEYEEEEDDD